jgi:hypothetical protein
MRASVLTIRQILVWVDAYFARFHKWPLCNGGRIPGSLGETWTKVDRALRIGYRGLPGKSSLAQLLEEQRGVRNRMAPPPLTEEQILVWADWHFRTTGGWPSQHSGPIAGEPGETWKGINHALRLGYRGLPGGSSLALLLQAKRGVRNHMHLLPLLTAEIVSWARSYWRREGRLPTLTSGPIADAPGETWRGVQMALVVGLRGLPGGDSLHRLLQRNLRQVTDGTAQRRSR